MRHLVLRTARFCLGARGVQIGGMYVRADMQRLIAQKTLVISADDGLFVLQLNTEGVEDQAVPLMDATALIDEQTSRRADEQTRITP